MKLFRCFLILSALYLTSCQTVQPDLNSTAVVLATETIPTIPPPTSTIPIVTPTQTPLEIASLVLSELSIYVTRDAHGPCVWEMLIASAEKDAAREKYNNQFFTHVTVTCEVEWVLVSEWTEQALGYPLPEILGWSSDGKFVYFYDSIIPDGCQPLGGYQQNLRQVDLSTGVISSIPLVWTGGISLSHDSSKVIYYDWEKMDIGIFDLATSEEQYIPFSIPEQLEYWDAGNFVWSQDDQSVVFVIRYGDPCFSTWSSILRIDVQENEVATLVDSDDGIFYIAEWTEPNRVILTKNGETFWLNPVTGNLRIAVE